jgi:hypothetical protein
LARFRPFQPRGAREHTFVGFFASGTHVLPVASFRLYGRSRDSPARLTQRGVGGAYSYPCCSSPFVDAISTKVHVQTARAAQSELEDGSKFMV